MDPVYRLSTDPDPGVDLCIGHYPQVIRILKQGDSEARSWMVDRVRDSDGVEHVIARRKPAEGPA